MAKSGSARASSAKSGSARAPGAKSARAPGVTKEERSSKFGKFAAEALTANPKASASDILKQAIGRGIGIRKTNALQIVRALANRPEPTKAKREASIPTKFRAGKAQPIPSGEEPIDSALAGEAVTGYALQDVQAGEPGLFIPA